MSGVRVRRAGQADVEALVRLLRSFRDHLKAAGPSDAELRAHLPASLADGGVEFHCAWLDGEAVGFSQVRFFASVWAPGVEAHLEDLFVAAPARGRSAGRALLRNAMERARARGAVRLTLATNEGNAAAQALYRSEGLAPQGHALYPGGREVLWQRRLESRREGRQ